MFRDFSDIRGMDHILTDIATAVRDRKRLLLVGPPGCGKTMIASRVPWLLGTPTDHERAWIHAEFSGLRLERSLAETERPFRAPHHTISVAALASGKPRWMERIPDPEPACRCKRVLNGACQWHVLPKGPIPPAGEARLARFGVLYLDELHEFASAALLNLSTTLLEMGDTSPYVIASASPCPCGRKDADDRTGFGFRCECSESSVASHRERLARACRTLGIELRINVPLFSLRDMSALPPGRSTSELCQIVKGGAS